MTRRLLFVLLLGAGGPALLPPAARSQEPAAGIQQPAAGSQPLILYFVRHAEKLDDSRDPPLNDAGRARAGTLVHVLGQAGITRVWSTDFKRTRETAAPLADHLEVDVSLYSPTAAGDFLAQLLRTRGRHLVVGHSNTVPAMVEALGGDPGAEIPDWEYDRLYILVIDGNRVATLPLRFGAESRR